MASQSTIGKGHNMLTRTTVRTDGLVTLHKANQPIPHGDTPYIDWQLVQHWTLGASEALPYTKALEQKLFEQSKGA